MLHGSARRGRILNVGSVAGFQPGPFMAVYYATKAYANSFSEALSSELAGTGVTVTCLAESLFSRERHPERAAIRERNFDGVLTLGIIEEHFIDELLNLSRVSRVPLRIEEVDVSALAAQALARLREAEPTRNVAVSIAPGLRAFEERDQERSERYTAERGSHVFDPEYHREFEENPAAWTFFQSQPPSYRRAATWWVMNAKRPETRRRRLAALIEASADGRRPDALIVTKRPQPTP